MRMDLFRSLAFRDSAERSKVISRLHGCREVISRRGFRNFVFGSADFKKICTAHYDVVNPASQNANDNTAGVIVALDLARRLKDVTVVLTDGEEVGGVGARLLIEHLRDKGISPSKVVVLDVVGEGDIVVANSTATLPVSCSKISMPFQEAEVFSAIGWPSVCLSSFYSNGDKSFWGNFHTDKDVIERINQKAMTRVLEKAIEILGE